MGSQSDLAREIAARVASSYLSEDDEFDQRQADAPPAVLPKVQEDLEKELAQAGKMMSQTLRNMVRRRLSPKALPFFQLYITLRRISLGEEAPADLSDQYVKAVRLLTRIKSPHDGRKISPPIINDLIDRMPKMRGWLKRIERGGLVGDPTWRRIVENYAQDILRISRDKGVFMRGRRIGPQRWQMFRKMRPKEEAIERLKDEDPQAYEAVMLSRLTRGQIEARIDDDIESEGLVSQTLTIMRRRVKVGIDPIWMGELRQHEAQRPPKPRRLKKGEDPTDRWKAQKTAWDAWAERMGELRQLSTTVYTLDGEVMSVDQYKEWVLQDRERKSKAKKKLLPEEQIAALRKVDDATLDALDSPKSYVALTDDAAKHQAMTKIYAVQEMTDPETYLERKVVVSGRYKGCFVDDLVNEQGRLIEGTGYVYQPGTRRGSRVKRRIDPSDLEPYATMSEEHPGHMFLSLPGKIGPRGEGKHIDTVVKEIMEKLAKRVGPPGIILAGKTKVKDYRGKTQYKAAYYISPENFALVRQEIGGMALSRSAMKMLDSYFADLARAEQATEKENLKFYETEQLGGFRSAVKKPGKPARPLRLLTKQKQALAWLEANGDKGVVALDTGIGKTLTSIASMQKMLRDGWAESGSGTNGRFLYVAPKNLVGNIKDQIYDFLTREAAADLIGRLDVLSYAQFRTARRKGKVTVRRKVGGKVETFTYDPWEPTKYISIYFDEAQELANYRNKTSQAALSLKHPRKICLTASPMENEPMDAYVLAAVCNNIDLAQKGDEGRRLRRNMRLFKERFCEEVGGRIVGLKKTRPGATEEEELAKRDLHTWSKRNIFYADKEDVEEFTLPELEQETRTVVMPKTVEREYRKASKKIVGQLRALVEKFEKGGYIREVEAEGPETEEGGRPVAVVRISDPSTGDVKSIRKIPAAHDPKIEQWASKNMKPIIRLLWELALYPEAHVDLKKNPKIEESTRIVRDKLVDGGRSLLFTDDPKMVLKTAKGLSEKIPGKVHVAMLGSKGHFFRDGAEIKQYTVRGEVNGEQVDHTHKLPFTPRRYRLFPELEVDPVENRHYNKADWASFVLNQIVQPDSDVATCTLHGKSYSTGQNLQAFGTVIHLDRDTWNNEEMKQRTARSWRQGQDMPVHEIILDMKYAEPKDDLDRTMDEIRALFQVLSGKLFDKIIKDAQGTELGKEWTEEMEKRMASFLKLDQETFEMSMSPWLGGLPIMM